MNKILNALKWFSDGLTFRFGCDLDWDYFSVGLSYNRPYSYQDLSGDLGMTVVDVVVTHYVTRRLALHLGPIELFVEGK